MALRGPLLCLRARPAPALLQRRPASGAAAEAGDDAVIVSGTEDKPATAATEEDADAPFRLTVDPETAHRAELEKYAEYRDHMKTLFSGDRMKRRRDLVKAMPPAELVRRTREYGVWGSRVYVDPDNRWVGLLEETKLPERFRTADARAARYSWNLFYFSLGVWLTFILTVSRWDNWYFKNIYRHFVMVSASYTQGAVYEYEGGAIQEEIATLCLEDGLIEGEEPCEGEERLWPWRWARLRDEWNHRNSTERAEVDAATTATVAAPAQ